MSDITFSPTLYRHQKIAELLAVFWACNDADSENAVDWTRPHMVGTVCNPLMQAVRALLNADFYIYDNADDLVEQVIESLLDNQASLDYQVTRAVKFVLSDNDCS